MNAPYWAQSFISQWQRSRASLAGKGWDVSQVSIGYYDGIAKLADDTGAYIVRLGRSGNTFHASIGYPSKATEWTFYNRD